MRHGTYRWAGVCLLLLSGLSPSPAHAGAWTKDQYHFYLQLGTAFSFADRRFDINGNGAPISVKKNMSVMDRQTNVSNYQQLLSDLYFEFGLLPRLTLFGDLTFSSARQLNPGGDITYSASAVGDTLLGARMGLVTDPIAVAFEARLTLPTGSQRAVIPTGSGDLRGEMRLAVGKALTVLPIYFDFEFGFTLRGSAEVNDFLSSSGKRLAKYAPELVIHGEIGAALVRWKQADRLVLAVAVDYRGSTERAEAADALFSLIPENAEFTTLGASLMWYVYHGIGVLGRFTQAVQGRRLPQTSSIGGALFVSW